MSGRRRNSSVGEARGRTPERGRRSGSGQRSRSPSSPTHAALEAFPREPIHGRNGSTDIQPSKHPQDVRDLLVALPGLKVSDMDTRAKTKAFNRRSGDLNGAGWARCSQFTGRQRYKLASFWGSDVFIIKVVHVPDFVSLEKPKISVRLMWEEDEVDLVISVMDGDSYLRPQLVEGKEKKSIPSAMPWTSTGAYRLGLNVRGDVLFHTTSLSSRFPVNTRGAFWAGIETGRGFDGLNVVVFVPALYGEPVPEDLVPASEGGGGIDEELRLLHTPGVSAYESSSEEEEKTKSKKKKGKDKRA